MPVTANPRTDIIFGYGSIFSERDCNEYVFHDLYELLTFTLNAGGKPPVPAEKLVKAMVSKIYPYEADPRVVHSLFCN